MNTYINTCKESHSMAKALNYEMCPICEQNTLKYDAEIENNRCYNEECRWVEKIRPDVSEDLARYAFEHARNLKHKEFLRKVLHATIQAGIEGKRRSRTIDSLLEHGIFTLSSE